MPSTPKPKPRRVGQTLAYQHVLMECPCGGDLDLCRELSLVADLARVTRQLSYVHEQHDLLRDDLAKLRDRIARSATRVLDLRAERDALQRRIRRQQARAG